ncbi:hypothetical protein L209DRAFT_774286 [Thermothelomyces heterothallicus CBS 203.75]
MLPALRHSTEPRAASCALRRLERQTRQAADVLERILRHSRHTEDVAENISVAEIDPLRCALRNLSPPAKPTESAILQAPARLRLLNRAAPFARKGFALLWMKPTDPSPVGCLATRMGRPRGVGEQVATGERAVRLATTTSSMSLHQNIKHPTSQSFLLVHCKHRQIAKANC